MSGYDPERTLLSRCVDNQYHPSGINEEAVRRILGHTKFPEYARLNNSLLGLVQDPNGVSAESFMSLSQKIDGLRAEIEFDLLDICERPPNKEEYRAALAFERIIKRG